jgi:ribosomal protein L32
VTTSKENGCLDMVWLTEQQMTARRTRLRRAALCSAHLIVCPDCLHCLSARTVCTDCCFFFFCCRRTLPNSLLS